MHAYLLACFEFLFSAARLLFFIEFYRYKQLYDMIGLI